MVLPEALPHLRTFIQNLSPVRRCWKDHLCFGDVLYEPLLWFFWGRKHIKHITALHPSHPSQLSSCAPGTLRPDLWTPCHGTWPRVEAEVAARRAIFRMSSWLVWTNWFWYHKPGESNTTQPPNLWYIGSKGPSKEWKPVCTHGAWGWWHPAKAGFGGEEASCLGRSQGWVCQSEATWLTWTHDMDLFYDISTYELMRQPFLLSWTLIVL